MLIIHNFELVKIANLRRALSFRKIAFRFKPELMYKWTYQAFCFLVGFSEPGEGGVISVLSLNNELFSYNPVVTFSNPVPHNPLKLRVITLGLHFTPHF